MYECDGSLAEYVIDWDWWWSIVINLKGNES